MQIEAVEMVAISVVVLLTVAGYFIIRDWSVLPDSSRSFRMQMIPYVIVFSILGFAVPVFWGIAVLVLIFCCTSELRKWLFPPPVVRPFYLPEPISIITCRIQAQGERRRSVKAELLPPFELPRN